ncbi:MAG: hypothetical protein ACM3QX_16885 [Syntrophomonadaceae bacterium]
MQLKRISLVVILSLFFCSFIYGQQCTSRSKTIHKKKTVVTKYRKPPRISSWQMEKLRSREKFTTDWINRLEKELSQYRQERAEIRRDIKELIAQDIKEKLEAKSKLEREQKEQVYSRDKEIEALQQMSSEIDTTK